MKSLKAWDIVPTYASDCLLNPDFFIVEILSSFVEVAYKKVLLRELLNEFLSLVGYFSSLYLSPKFTVKFLWLFPFQYVFFWIWKDWSLTFVENWDKKLFAESWVFEKNYTFLAFVYFSFDRLKLFKDLSW